MSSKHHYVPRFYLEGFVDPAMPSHLWVADKEKGLVRRESPSRAARASGYYDLTKTKYVKASVFEEFLSIIESRVAAVIDKIRQHDYRLTIGEAYHLSNYLGLQLARVPAFRQVLKDVMKSYAENEIREYVMDDDRLRSRYGDEADFFKEYVLSGKLKPVPGKDYVLGSTIKFGIDAAQHIFGKKWMFLTTSGNATFFTSDNPVGLLTPDATPPRGKQPLADKKLEISFAISPSIAILMHSHDEHEDNVEVNATTVIEMNRRVFPTIQRYAYTSRCSQAEWALSQWTGSA